MPFSLQKSRNVWSKAFGQTRSTMNMIFAVEDALRQLAQIKTTDAYKQQLKILEGGERKKEATPIPVETSE